MNFRCNLKCAEAKELAARNDIRSLRYSDQLILHKDGDELMQRFYEEEINFLPTFKYDKKSTVYDTSKKQRTPSYTDRILVSINDGGQRRDFSQPAPHESRLNGNQCTVDYYNRRESLYSDHRPVLAIFSLKVRKVNEASLASLRHQILADLKKNRPAAPTNQKRQPSQP